MDQGELIAELERAGRDKELTARAVRRLAEPGAAAAPGLVAALGTVSRQAMWGLRDSLRLIGPAAFDAAVAARARAEKVPDWWELGHVLRGFDERCFPQYVAALSHPMKEIRRQALWGLQNLGDSATAAVVDVIPFLDDADRYTRYQAEKTIRAIGRQSGPVLRGIRREGPAYLRRHALSALSLIGGEAEIDERDRRALERLVRIKVAEDIPESLPEHRWLAVPGATYEGLFAAVGLHDRRPCTVSMGQAAMEDDVALVAGPDGVERAVYRVFVTPELDGWRLVYADTPLGEMHWDVDDLLRRISAACGQAQYFFQDDHSDSMVWALAVDGEVRRSYWRYGEPEWRGVPLDWEQPLGADPDFDPDDDHEPNATQASSVDSAARELSLDPTGVGEQTPMRGHGWLAVTEEGVGHGPFTGALRI
ncbi:HEAT repeat domain-containing protein [Streptomyces sp. NPDC087901]|uniref:HEAT repeat domain-containing protein n=1 Tax=Streptomyces sp. NPDC087901 TaxID=3365818 RepID=UPI00382E8F3E